MIFRILVVILPILVTAVFSESTSVKITPRSSENLSFEDLLYTDADASLIWDFVEKYNILENRDKLISNKTHLKCVEELNVDHELIGPYLVNITLYNVFSFLYDTVYHDLQGTKLSHAEDLQNNITETLKNDEVYYAAVEKIREKIGHNKTEELTCLKNSTCACISLPRLELYWEYRDDLKDKEKLVSDFIMFGSKVDPPIRIIVIIIGLVLNSALLVTFIKEQSVRRESNICIFNLLINNFIILVIYTPLQYVHKYHHYNMYTEYTFHVFELIVISVNVFIVLIISAQRYFDVTRALKPNIEGCRLSPFVRCCIYSNFVWMPSIVISVLLCLNDSDTIHGLQTVLFLLIYLLLLAILLVVFNSLSARKLQRAVEHGALSLENETIISSTVVLAITGVYYLIFTLFFIYLPFEKYHGERIYQYYFSIERRIFSLIFHNIFSLYPTIIVLALYRSSSDFRKYLRKYLFRCWLEPSEEKYVTMSSVKSDET